ncbi:unnamed protein product (macronuclear) [Paramecium tetraurelia]|uniref:Uncharacterized protein n=1 Tax=Paramecium tetraurelia TaxID=5888 RepID=A0D8E8_PARTE|nr:uncharacterized protein GSPATT00014261001 [Paramecium tetraurelia]CAK79315.1 unnamed protein product [Paramecium tetraurelia]|eukprot:XP_001446712.1 hypothetical protein (macronuclear) [Paramecium tetraurelia strain d4-2]
MLDKNKIDINSYKQEISNIEEAISILDKEIKYDKNDEMEFISSDNQRDQLQNTFNQVSDFQAQGEQSKVLAGQYSGGLIHHVYIVQYFYLVPKDAKNLQDMCQKDFINSDGKKYRATIEGEKWQFDLGVKAQPHRKKMVYSILTNWNSGSTILWFKIQILYIN